MADREITTVFKADISNFSASTQQLNRYVAQVNSEFKDATASMGKWNDNAEGLRAKITQLNKLYDAESKKLKDLESRYDEVVRTQGANSKAAQDLATAINNQSAKVKETKKNIDHYADSLKELEDAGVNTKEELDKLNKKLDEQKQAAKDIGSGIAKGAAAGIAGIGAACVGAFAAIKNIVEETKELRTQLGMLETAFTQSGHSVEASKKTYNELFSILGESDQATEASQHLAKMAKSEKELEQMTKILTGVYATFGKSLPVEGLAEAMNHTAKLGSVQGPLADALEWSGINVDVFNEELANLNTEEERAAHINETLNGLYGETAEQYKEVNKEVIAANDAQNKYNQAMAEVGEKAQPVITKFQVAMTDLLVNVVPPLSTALSWIIDNLNILLPVIGSVTAGIVAQTTATKIKTITDLASSKGISVMTLAQKGLNAAFKANPIGLVITAVGLLVTAFVTLWNKCEGFRNFWIGLWNGIKNAFGVVVGWIKENWQSMLLFLINPLAGIFKYCYEHFEGFRNFVDNTVSAIKTFFTDLWNGIAKFFTDLWNGIVTGVQTAWNWVAGLFSTVASWIYDNVIAPIAKFFTDLWNGIVNAYHTVIDPWIEIFRRISVIVDEEIIQPIKRFFVDLWNGIVTGLQEAWNWVVNLCSTVASWIYENVIMPIAQFFTGLWSGISTAAVNAWAAIKSAFVKAAEWFNTTIIQPVVNVFSTMWNGLTNGAKAAWEGIKGVFSTVGNFFGDVFSKAWQKVKNVFSTGGKIFDGIKDGIVTAFKTVVNAIITGINKVITVPFNAINGILEKIKGIEIVGVKPFNWVNTFSVPQIPQLAEGGVVDKATLAMIGEAGKEVVMPLENNTGWIDKLAEKISAKTGNHSNTYNITNKFEKMETSRIALHKANLETKRILGGVI